MAGADRIARLNAAVEGRYHIDRELGEGGVATVFLADDLKHERKVALKVLKPDLAAVVGGDRFLAEIKTTATLQHPHILPLFDSGEAEGLLFYVMPYVEGESLRERLDREHQLPVDEAVGIATGLAEALDYAHRHGVIHRDIKPANILLQDGKPVISDFGIALAVGAAGGRRLTETGLSLGTPHYMSPEQATGDLNLGPATDVWALGCVLHEMLVGEPPFTGSTPQAVLGKIITGEVPSTHVERPSVPPNVDAVIAKALEKVPADRFTSGGAVSRALRDPSYSFERRALAAPGTRLPRRLMGAWSLTVAALLIVIVWLLTRPDDPVPVARFDVTPREGHGLRPNNFWVGYALTPQGDRLIYEGATPGGALGLWERRLDDLVPRLIPGTENGWNPVVSPDGSSIAFQRGQSIVRVPLDAGPARILVDSGVGHGIDWGPDDQIYFPNTDGSAILRVPASGGPLERVTEPTEALELPHVLPDGRGILVTLTRASLAEAAIGVAGPDGVVKELMSGFSARYAASGHLVYGAADGNLMAAPFDLSRLETTGAPVALAEALAVARAIGIRAAQFTLSKTGHLVYRSGEGLGGVPTELVWLDRSGEATPVQPGWSFRSDDNLKGWSVSRDGDRIAVGVERDDNLDIYVKELPDGPFSRLTFDDAADVRPRWGPDGATITFPSNRGGRWHLMSKRADGFGEARDLFDFEGALGMGEGFWSPDGEWLVLRYSLDGTRPRVIYGYRPEVDDGPIPLVTEADAATPALSPDGQWIAYALAQAGRREVFVSPFPNVSDWKRQISSNGGGQPLWSPDGTELFFTDQDRGLNVASIETESGFRHTVPRLLFEFDASYELRDYQRVLDITSDGQRFLAGRTVGEEDRLVWVQNFREELERLVAN